MNLLEQGTDLRKSGGNSYAKKLAEKCLGDADIGNM
jgi:hypothetical protein